MHTDLDADRPILKSDGDDTTPPSNVPPHNFSFEDTVTLRAPKPALWTVLSDPVHLETCLPGVEAIEWDADRSYTCGIVQSISGVTHLTLSMTGTFELVALDAPDWAVIRGAAHDPDTATELDIVAAVELATAGDEAVDLTYTADVSLRSYNAAVTPEVLGPTVRDSIERAMEQLEDAASGGGEVRS